MKQLDRGAIAQKYTNFSFDSFTFSKNEHGLLCQFSFTCHEFHFSPTLLMGGVTQEMIDALGSERLRCWVFQLGLVEMLSYWKAFVTKTITVHAGHLDDTAVLFWQKLFRHGLGEFFYKNGIEPFAPTIISSTKAFDTARALPPKSNKSSLLVPVGGGKDSIVVLETLAARGYLISTLSGHTGSSGAVIDLFSKRHTPEHQRDIVFTRTIDPQLLSCNEAGFYNGHTPFSAFLAFFSTCVADLFDIPYVALANEASANEETVFWKGLAINHQYSKSVEFEEDFRAYSASLFAQCPEYFSLLRQKDEVAISAQFVKYPEYFPVFHSCNVAQRTNTWCGNCPKCVFVALMLAAHVDKETLVQIFPRDLFANEKNTQYLEELLGMRESKPFECVGTREESRRALATILSKEGGTFPLFEQFRSQRLDVEGKKTSQVVKHFIPKQFLHMYPAFLSNSARIAIVGFGREGHSTYRFLRKNFPEASIALFDEQKDEKTLREESYKLDKYTALLPKNPENFDVVLKTPGIHKERLSRFVFNIDQAHITSQSDLFVQMFGGQTIAVTGTKGKSTTAHSISCVFQSLGIPCVLVGNIGVPPLDVIESVGEDTLVVFEMSAFQSESLTAGTHCSVFTSLYRDHLDYYRDFEEYVRAKSRVFSLQSADDILLYRADDTAVAAIAKQNSAQTFAYANGKMPKALVSVHDDAIYYTYKDQEQKLISLGDLQIVGKENQVNCLPAVFFALFYDRVRRTIDTAKIQNSPEGIQAALQTIQPLSGRMEKIATVGTIDFYDDALATIPEAVIAALNSLPEVTVLFVGGHERKQEYGPLVDAIVQKGVRALVVFPQTADRIEEEVKKKSSIAVHRAQSMEDAVRYAYSVCQNMQNATVLLSAGAPSFGLFTDYADRSAQYKENIDLLQKSHV